MRDGDSGFAVDRQRRERFRRHLEFIRRGCEQPKGWLCHIQSYNRGRLHDYRHPRQRHFPEHRSQRRHGVRWSYFAFTNSRIRRRSPDTIKRWYEIEMKKISSSDKLQCLLDDPDATKH